MPLPSLLQAWSNVKPAKTNTFTALGPTYDSANMNTCVITDADGAIEVTATVGGVAATTTYSEYPAEFNADKDTTITVSGKISKVEFDGNKVALKSGSFKELNFSEPNALQEIYIDNANGSLSVVELGGCAELTDLTVIYASGVETLIFDGCPKLKRLTVASLAALNVGNEEAEVMAGTLPETTDGVLVHAPVVSYYPDNYFAEFAAVAKSRGWTVVEQNETETT